MKVKLGCISTIIEKVEAGIVYCERKNSCSQFEECSWRRNRWKIRILSYL